MDPLYWPHTAALVAGPPPAPHTWLVPGMVGAEGFGLLLAPTRGGKSTLSVQLAAALDAGTPFLGLPTERTRVLYVQADCPLLDWYELVGRVAPAATFASVLVDANWWGDARQVERVTAAIRDTDPGFLIWDALQSTITHGLRLNEQQDMARIVAELRRWSRPRPFWVLHHHNKPQDRRPTADPEALWVSSLGHSYLPTQASLLLGILRDPDSDGAVLKTDGRLARRDVWGLRLTDTGWVVAGVPVDPPPRPRRDRPDLR